MDEVNVTQFDTVPEFIEPEAINPADLPTPEQLLPGDDDIGVDKEDVAALAEPVKADLYIAKFAGLKKNIYKAEDGTETFLGYVHATKSGGKKIIPTFKLISDDPIVNNRAIFGHIATNMRVFAQIDRHLDLLTGRKIDPAKVEAALNKVVLLSVGYEKESVDPQTGRTYQSKNTIVAVLPYKG